jgi:steroid 5-alpha reductase family enzyme
LNAHKQPSVEKTEREGTSLMGSEGAGTSFLALTSGVTAGYQFIFFVLTYVLRIDTATDFAGTSNFLVLALLTFSTGKQFTFRKLVVTALVCVWALRLSGFLLYRILLWGEDRRLDTMRGNLPKLALFWTFQALWVWTVSLPVSVLNSSARDPALGAPDYIGWALFVAGMVLESAADFQKLHFRKMPHSQKKWIDIGVWKWSRHPNYFGEILLWTGVFVSSSPVFVGWDWVSIVSPFFLIWLLLFVSGIPLLEASSNKKHKGFLEYKAYKERTSILIPFPPALYSRFPLSVRSSILLDWPLYDSS